MIAGRGPALAVGAAVVALADVPAMWGFMGAVIYAAPRLLDCMHVGVGWSHVARCTSQAAIQLLIGTIAAAAFTPWVQSYIHATSPEDARAMSTVFGMLANAVAPRAIKSLSDSVVKRIGGGH